MDPHETAGELERLRAQLEAVESLHAQAEQSRTTLRHDIDTLQEQIKHTIESCERAPQRRRIGLPAAPPAALSSDLFTGALGEPTIPVHVGETTLHVHGPVLRSIPCFAAQLEGPWIDRDCIRIELPCNVAEFCLLLKRIYTGELLGSPRLPVENCAAALRLCSAASMLLIDDKVLELPSVVLASIVTPEDATMALGAVDELPASIAEMLEGLSDMPTPTSSDIEKMISTSSTPQARDATSQVLCAHRGRLDYTAIATAAKECVTNFPDEDGLEWRLDWSILLAREHLHCGEATSVFAHVGSLFCNECGDSQMLRKVPADFLAHLLRCAKSNALSQAIGLGKGNRGIYCRRCGISNRRSILTIGPREAAGFADAIAAAPRERSEVAAQLAKFPPTQLVDVLSESIAAALGDRFDTIVEHMISEPYLASQWFTKERLLRLPMGRRRAVSLALLRDAASDLSGPFL